MGGIQLLVLLFQKGLLKIPEGLDQVLDGDAQGAQCIFLACRAHRLNVAVEMHVLSSTCTSSSPTRFVPSLTAVTAIASAVLIVAATSRAWTVALIAFDTF